MPPRKKSVSAVASTPKTLKYVDPPASTLPGSMRFPLTVLVNFSLSALLYSLASQWGAGDLSSVSRAGVTWYEAYGFVGLKVVELTVGWFGDYDSTDVAALTLLSRFPYYNLLTTFYNILPSTAIVFLAIDTLAVYLPYRLLRPVSPAHSFSAPTGSVANRAILDDIATHTALSALSAGLYAIVIGASYWTFLRTALVVGFDGLRDVSATYDSQFIQLFAYFLPVGLATKVFLFTPSTAARPDKTDKKIERFNPETATLGETLLWNLWGYSKRSRTLIIRTATLAGTMGASTFVQSLYTVEGAKASGVIAWAGIWSASTLISGFAYWWVAHVDEVKN